MKVFIFHSGRKSFFVGKLKNCHEKLRHGRNIPLAPSEMMKWKKGFKGPKKPSLAAKS
jgi:hypothetical protein